MQCLTRGGSVDIIMDGEVPAPLRERLRDPLRQALRGRGVPCCATVAPGRNPDEVVVTLRVADHPVLPLYLPATHRLQSADILRIMTNVLDGLGTSLA